MRLRLLLVLSSTALLIGALGAVGGSRDVRDRVVDMAVDFLEPLSQPGGPVKAFSVEPGEGGSEIAERLAREGIIRYPVLFRFLVSYYGVGRDLKAGRYTLSSEAGLREIIYAITQGREELVTVTIPEGWRAEEVADLLEARGIAKRSEFLRLVYTGGAGVQDIPVHPPLPSLEGYLFPDTYLMPKDFGAEAFLGLMLKTFEERFTDEMLKEAQGMGLSVHQAVTLASIIEREALLPQEQSLVAGVFLNRLREAQPLAADPTIQYALVPPESPPRQQGYWKPDLTLDELKLDSPYNTYMHPGLPPTPIASPGLGALRAVLQPQESPYRYFVAKPDGSHAFATTFEEHLRNVALYRQR